MELVGPFGRSLARSRTSALAHEATDATVTAVAAAAVGYLSAKSNLKGQGGKIAKLPIPLAGALLLGVLGQSGLAGSASHHVMSAAKGCLAAQATMLGIKQAYQGTNQPAVVAAVPRYVPYGQLPRMGATPGTEAMFAKAGLTPQPQAG